VGGLARQKRSTKKGAKNFFLAPEAKGLTLVNRLPVQTRPVHLLMQLGHRFPKAGLPYNLQPARLSHN
jgi:hypothetical protein